jgi:hypothetical protein
LLFSPAPPAGAPAQDEPVRDLLDRRDMHGRGEAVIRGLAHIDVVVGVHRRLLPPLATQHLARSGRDHLIDVHVGLSAGSGLPYQQWKMIIEFSVHHLARRPRYGLGALLVEGAQPMVDLGRRMFDEA